QMTAAAHDFETVILSKESSPARCQCRARALRPSALVDMTSSAHIPRRKYLLNIGNTEHDNRCPMQTPRNKRRKFASVASAASARRRLFSNSGKDVVIAPRPVTADLH